MSSLRDIRQRLRSIENIKKIADAMERVAAARLKKAQAQAEQSRPYVKKMQEVLENLAASEFTHPLFEERKVKKTGLIVIAADKGLSGSYNGNILHASDRFLSNYNPGTVELLLFGRKAIEYYNSKKYPIKHEKSDWGGKLNFQEISKFVKGLTENFLLGSLDEVWIIYTHYVNVMTREVKCEKYLNIGKPKGEQKGRKFDYIFETDPVQIYSELLPFYLTTRLQTALHESYASELAARIVAMQTASKNSENIIEDLTLVRNKVRQEMITREIIEISRKG